MTMHIWKGGIADSTLDNEAMSEWADVQMKGTVVEYLSVCFAAKNDKNDKCGKM